MLIFTHKNFDTETAFHIGKSQKLAENQKFGVLISLYRNNEKNCEYYFHDQGILTVSDDKWIELNPVDSEDIIDFIIDLFVTEEKEKHVFKSFLSLLFIDTINNNAIPIPKILSWDFKEYKLFSNYSLYQHQFVLDLDVEPDKLRESLQQDFEMQLQNIRRINYLKSDEKIANMSKKNHGLISQLPEKATSRSNSLEDIFRLVEKTKTKEKKEVESDKPVKEKKEVELTKPEKTKTKEKKEVELTKPEKTKTKEKKEEEYSRRMKTKEKEKKEEEYSRRMKTKEKEKKEEEYSRRTKTIEKKEVEPDRPVKIKEKEKKDTEPSRRTKTTEKDVESTRRTKTEEKDAEPSRPIKTKEKEREIEPSRRTKTKEKETSELDRKAPVVKLSKRSDSSSPKLKSILKNPILRKEPEDDLLQGLKNILSSTAEDPEQLLHNLSNVLKSTEDSDILFSNLSTILQPSLETVSSELKQDSEKSDDKIEQEFLLEVKDMSPDKEMDEFWSTDKVEFKIEFKVESTDHISADISDVQEILIPESKNNVLTDPNGESSKEKHGTMFRKKKKIPTSPLSSPYTGKFEDISEKTHLPSPIKKSKSKGVFFSDEEAEKELGQELEQDLSENEDKKSTINYVTKSNPHSTFSPVFNPNTKITFTGDFLNESGGQVVDFPDPIFVNRSPAIDFIVEEKPISESQKTIANPGNVPEIQFVITEPNNTIPNFIHPTNNVISPILSPITSQNSPPILAPPTIPTLVTNPIFPSTSVANPIFPSTSVANPIFPSTSVANPIFPSTNPIFPAATVSNPIFPPEPTTPAANPIFPAATVSNPIFPPGPTTPAANPIFPVSKSPERKQSISPKTFNNIISLSPVKKSPSPPTSATSPFKTPATNSPFGVPVTNSPFIPTKSSPFVSTNNPFGSSTTNSPFVVPTNNPFGSSTTNSPFIATKSSPFAPPTANPFGTNSPFSK